MRAGTSKDMLASDAALEIRRDTNAPEELLLLNTVVKVRNVGAWCSVTTKCRYDSISP